MLKTKKAGLVTKIVILLLFIYAAFMIWNLNSRIQTAEAEVGSLHDQVQMQTQQNNELQVAIDNSDDPEQRRDIARAKLGLLEPSEKVFHITD